MSGKLELQGSAILPPRPSTSHQPNSLSRRIDDTRSAKFPKRPSTATASKSRYQSTPPVRKPDGYDIYTVHDGISRRVKFDDECDEDYLRGNGIKGLEYPSSTSKIDFENAPVPLIDHDRTFLHPEISHFDILSLEDLDALNLYTAPPTDLYLPNPNEPPHQSIPHISSTFHSYLSHNAASIQLWWRYHKSRHHAQATLAKIKTIKNFREKVSLETEKAKIKSNSRIRIAKAAEQEKDNDRRKSLKKPISPTKKIVPTERAKRSIKEIPKPDELSVVSNKVTLPADPTPPMQVSEEPEPVTVVILENCGSAADIPEEIVFDLNPEDSETLSTVGELSIKDDTEPISDPTIKMAQPEAKELVQLIKELDTVEELEPVISNVAEIPASSSTWRDEAVIPAIETKPDYTLTTIHTNLLNYEFQGETEQKESSLPLPSHNEVSPYTRLDAEFHSDQTGEDATNKRIDRILDYLQTVEDEDVISVSSAAISTRSVLDTMSFRSMDVNNLGNAPHSGSVFDGVRTKLVSQQLELEEKTRTLNLLKKELKRLKECNKEQQMHYRKDMKSKLNLQRKEYETIVKRHLGFIDKLLAEKEEVSKKCETLTDEVKSLEKQFNDKMKATEELHSRDVKQQKELWAAAEKIKRDKWISEQTKKIKETTVKGLEPEIQRMIGQHKFQLRQLEERFQEQLSKEKEMINEQNQRQLEQLREKWNSERQRACEEEREFSRQRYQKQLERDEMEFQQQKRKAAAQFQEEKDALTASMKDERKSEEKVLKSQIDELRREIEREKMVKIEVCDELRRKNGMDVIVIKERMEIEKEEWQSMFIHKKEEEMRHKEKQFKEKLLRERDTEIEMIIQRLESESSSNNSDIHRRHRMEIERLKAEMSDDTRSLKDQHNVALDKVLGAQSDLKHAEDMNRDMQKELIKIQTEFVSQDNTLRRQKTELERLKVDEFTLASNIRKDFEVQMASYKESVQTLEKNILQFREQIEVLRRKHGKELEEASQEKQDTLHMVEARVRKSIAMKDEVINSLKNQTEELKIKNCTLESLIEQQRQEFLA